MNILNISNFGKGNTYYNQIDNNSLKRYNSYCSRNMGLQADTCSFKGVKNMIKKEEADQILKNLKTYKNLEDSPVSYVKPLVEKYLKGEIGEFEFMNKFMNETRMAKYNLSQMPQEDIQNNQKLFKSEFQLVDELYSNIKKNNELPNLMDIIKSK